jgi:hypothetical protein
MQRSTITREARGRAAWRVVARAACALAMAVWSSSNGCVLVVCSETCDPCLGNCKCHENVCPHPNGFDETHRLAAFEPMQIVGGDGSVTHVFAHILGLSLTRALGAGSYDSKAYAQFAQGVLDVNGDLLAPSTRLGRFVLASFERFDSTSVVVFRESAPGSASASFLFDARGNLLEIDHELGAP